MVVSAAVNGCPCLGPNTGPPYYACWTNENLAFQGTAGTGTVCYTSNNNIKYQYGLAMNYINGPLPPAAAQQGVCQNNGNNNGPQGPCYWLQGTIPVINEQCYLTNNGTPNCQTRTQPID